MKLLERYATFLGLQIGKQHLLENFFPLPFIKFITLHASSGMGAKNYPYFALVVELIKPYLSAEGIEIVQIGLKDDPAIPGCHHTMGQTSIHQANYVVSRSLLHISNDSVWSHRVGHLGIPLLELFGSTTVENHSPYDFNPDKTIFLSSHRWGRNASFVAQENPQSIALIDPYDIARAALKLLGITNSITQRTHFIGLMYQNPVIEWIPDSLVDPNFNKDLPFVVRMDKNHDENILAQALQSGRKIHLFAKTPIVALGIFQQFKDSILSYNHEINSDCPIPYIKTVKALLSKTSFFSRLKDEQELSQLRFQFIDYTMIEQASDLTREDYSRESAKYLNEPDVKTVDRLSHLDKLKFKTNKYVLSKGQAYLSYAHLAVNQPLVGEIKYGNIIDVPEFWNDLNHLFVYTNE